MAEHSSYQKKLIGRYYDRRDEIMLNRIGEIVTDLLLAETDRKRDQLWKRAATAMKNLKVPGTLVTHILSKRDEKILAQHLREWLKTVRTK